MDCFNHAATAAIGICRFCGRGICHGCARTDGRGLSCGEACEAELGELREINERAKRIYGIGAHARKRLPLAALMWGAFALLFGGFGAHGYYGSGRIEWFPVLFGALCAVLCVVTWWRMRDLKLNC